MNTKLKHFLANLLVVLLVLEPFSFALAGGITVAPGSPASKQPTMDTAPNGVTVINIVKPNASGLSHNQFDQFNVPVRGVIINNSSRVGVSQLGGAISGNANFGGGAEARIILNEVTGSSRSRIEGYTEIFGFAAQYILANPNGISVNGGGFINTPKATLTTGVPRFDAAGGLLGLDVRQGDVLIDGQGLNAGNIDAFEIVSRTAKINAEIHARNLSIIAGQGSYDPATGQSAPLAPDGSAAPTFALDSTALGGMYAQRIKFVGTEAGVGVNLGGAVRATEQLTLTADGRIQIAGAVSSDKDAAVTSRSGPVGISGKFGAGGTVAVEAAQELRLASLAGADAPLLYGSTAIVSAGKLTNVDGKMLAEKTLSATTTGDLSNAGTIFAGTHATLAPGGKLANSGEIRAKGTLTIESQGGMENSGTLQAGADLTARSGSGLSNTGTIAAKDTLTAEATGTLDNSGTLYSDGAGSFKASTLNNLAGARIETLGDALFGTSAGFTNAGSINTGGKVTLGAAGLLRNEATGQMLAQTGIGLEALGDFANLGTLSSGGTSAYNVAGQFLNSGTLSHSGSSSLSVPNLVNDATGQILFSGDSLLSVSGDLTNAGLLYSGGKATYRVGGTLLNNRGQMLTQGDMLLEGITAGSRMTKLQNDSGGIESLGGGLTFRAQTMVNNNLDFTLEEGAIAGPTLEGGMHSYGNDVWGVGPIFSWATGRGYSSAFAWNANRIHTAYANALGLDTTRSVFSLAQLTAALAKAEQELAATPDASRQTLVTWVKVNVIAPQSRYAIMIQPGQRGEITVYEATTATDRAAGMDKGASIAASTNIAIDADAFRNNVSKVSTATGDISINAADFENVGRTLYERSTVKWGRGFTNNSKNKGVYSEGNGQEVLLSPVGYAYGSINAGGKVSLAAGQARNGVNENAGAVGTGNAKGIMAPAKPVALGQTLPSVSDLIGTLPAGGLFSVNTTPGHHYLVETNPALTNMSDFYGSDYFLSRAGIDLDKTHQQLLGDAFYETRLVREQIFSLTGKRLLSSSATSDAEQMQALMDSALRAKSSLDLTIGVALSQAQLAQLTEDIVWLEKTVVDGHEVLAPKVYLASASLTKIAQGGSVIVGKDVAITTTGDTSNTGAIQAANTLTINAANIFNTLGTIQGQTAALAATDSITNTSGLIKGGEVTLAAGKNIVSDTASITFASSNTTSEVANQRGRIEASGNLNMQAGENISLIGSDAAAGGSATLSAGKDVILAAQQTKSSFATSQGSKYSASASVVGNQEATLSTGGALSVTAGQDAVIHGSTVQAGGDASLSAGRNLSITSATDTYEFSRQLQSKGGGLFGGKSSESASGSGSTNVASQVTSGGSLSAQAGKAGSGDLVVSGSKLSAAQDVKLAAASNANILAAQMTSSSQYQSSSSSFGGLISSSGSKDNRKVTTERSEITAGGDVSVEAQKDITLTAAKITSGGETQLVANNGNVSLLTSKDSEYNRSVSSNVGWLTWSSQDKGKSAETIVNTLITTGKGLTITSRDGVTVEYKRTGDLRQDIQQLSQAQGLEWMSELLKRDDVNWKGVQEQYESWNKKDGGISPAATIAISIIAAAATAGAASELALYVTGLQIGEGGALLASGVAANAVQIATYSALQAGIVSIAAKTATGVVDAAAGGDLGKNLGSMLTEEGVRSLLASMVLAGSMGTMGSTFAEYGKPGEILATTAVKTITSSLVGGEELQKAFLTSLGSSFDSYAKGMISAAELDASVVLVLRGATGAAGAALAGGDPVQGAISSIVSQLAENVKVAPLSKAQKDEIRTFAPLSQCAYGEVCTPPPGYGLLTEKDIKSAGVDLEKLFDSSKGLHVDFYFKPGEEGAMGSIILAARGSDELKDWTGTNLPQVTGNVGDQYRQVTDLKVLKGLSDLAQKFNANLDATGHSLAGGLGTALAATGTFRKVVTFNAAVLNPATYGETGGNKSATDTVVTNYVTRSDPLTFLQNLVVPDWMAKNQVMLESGYHDIGSVVEKYKSK